MFSHTIWINDLLIVYVRYMRLERQLAISQLFIASTNVLLGIHYYTA